MNISRAALGRFKSEARNNRQSPARIALRRMRPGTMPPLSAIALAVDLGGRVDGSDAETLFAALQIVALLADQDVPKAYLGRALQEAGVSELRLERLLRAPPDQVPEQVRAVARHLLARGTPVLVIDLIRLLVSQDRESRLRIAQSYYKNLASKESTNA